MNRSNVAGEGAAGGDADLVLAGLRAKIDQRLLAGTPLPVDDWLAQFPELAGRIVDLVALREGLHAEHLLGDEWSEAPHGDSLLLADIAAQLRDATSRGTAFDLVGWQARNPDLAAEIERISQLEEAMAEMLAPELAPKTVPAQGVPEAGLGRYRLLSRLTTHPAGPIYLGRVQGSGDEVELMVLRPEVSADVGWKLLREAEQSRRLGAQGVVPVREVGEVRGVRFIAWTHLRGVALNEAIEELAFYGGERRLYQVVPPDGRLTLEATEALEAPRSAPEARAILSTNLDHILSALRLVGHAAEVISRAHLAGRLHLDLSPSAVLVASDGLPYLRFFGLARHYRVLPPETTRVPLYRAPELLFGPDARVDWRADVYGLGALLFALLQFDAPIDIDPTHKVGLEVLTRLEARVKARAETLPPPVAALLTETLRWPPESRLASADAVQGAIRRAVDVLTRPLLDEGAPQKNARGFWRRLSSRKDKDSDQP